MKVRFMTRSLGDTSSGGVKQIYRMAEVLAGAGVDAAVVRGPESPEPWFRTEAPAVEGVEWEDGDVMVLAEVDTPMSLVVAPKGVRVVVYAQGAFLVPMGLGGAATLARAYERVDAVMCVSEHSVRAVEWMLPGKPVHRIVHAAREPFTLGAKKKLLSYMPRKDPYSLDVVMEMLGGRGSLKGWRVQEIDRMTEAEVAEVMRESAIFVHAAQREGFGLPVLEAMACGCVVAGHHGHGAAEIFEALDLGRYAPEGDFIELARLTEVALMSDLDLLAEEGRRASEVVAKAYSEEGEVKSILDTWAAMGVT